MEKEKQKQGIGIKDKVGYFLGDFGCNLVFTLIANYMLLYYTQLIGISLIDYSIITVITKIWDIVTTPYWGIIIDRLIRKKGTYKVIIRRAIIPLMITTFAVFLPLDIIYIFKIMYVILVYFAWSIFYSLINVSYGTMLHVITDISEERATLSTARSLGSYSAMLLTQVTLPIFVYKIQDGKSVFQGTIMPGVSLAICLISGCSIYLLTRLVTERICVTYKKENKSKNGYWKTLQVYLRDRDLLSISLATIFQSLFLVSTSSISMLVFQLYFGDGRWISIYSLLAIISKFVIVPFIPGIVKRYGLRKAVSYPILFSIVLYLAMGQVPQSLPLLWVFLSFLTNVFFGIYNNTLWALLSDGIESAEKKTDQMVAGTIYSIYATIRKVGQSVGQSGILLITALLIPGVELSNPSSWNIDQAIVLKEICTYMPIAGCVLMFFAFNFVNTRNKT